MTARVWTGNEGLRKLLAPVGDLRPHPKNPRKGNVEVIRSSLTRFGQQRPILALPDGTVVAGNHTLRAAVEEGWTHIAVVRSDLLAAEIEAYLLADNRTSDLGVYEDEPLAELLTRLQESDAGMVGTGYDDAQLKEILKGIELRARTSRGAPDDIPEVPEVPKSEPGTIYTLGDHRLMCGDSLDAEAVGQLLDGAKPWLLLTDPPYGVELDMEWRDRAGYNAAGAAESSYMQRTAGHTNTSISGDTVADWSPAFELVPSLKVAYVWHASAHTIEVGQGLLRIGFALNQQIIWNKERFVLSRQHYHWQHEPCWYARKPGSPRWRGSFDQATIWNAPSPKRIMGTKSDEKKIDHPTQKPVVLYTRPIENHLKLGECFYEPFGGSGTGIIAGEMTGRQCLAMEIDPRYVDVIRQRYADFVGDQSFAPA